MALASDRSDCFRCCRHASSLDPFHRQHLRCGLVQARRWTAVRCHHGKQERLGLWILQVHHALGREIGLYSAYSHKWFTGAAMVSIWHLILLQGQDIPKMVSFSLPGPYLFTFPSSFPFWLHYLAVFSSTVPFANVHCSIGLATPLCIECRWESSLRRKSRQEHQERLDHIQFSETLYIHICTEIYIPLRGLRYMLPSHVSVCQACIYKNAQLLHRTGSIPRE
jgi:hypothetical protein